MSSRNSYQTGSRRINQAGCECQDRDRHPVGCLKSGTMKDGWYLCGGCKRHAPQLVVLADPTIAPHVYLSRGGSGARPGDCERCSAPMNDRRIHGPMMELLPWD